jgi:hypothetical protein
MNFQFPIWISGSTARDGHGYRLVAFSSASRAYAYLSTQAIGHVEIELVSERRFRAMLPRLYAQGVVELSFDPEPDGSAAMTIVFSGVEDALMIADGRRA